MRSVLLIAVLMFLAACGKKPNDGSGPATQRPAVTAQAVLGEWVTVATSAGHYDGVMHLYPNGIFKEEDTFRRNGAVQREEGTFTMKTGATDEVVLITVEKSDGKPVPAGPPFELIFDRKEQTLSNLFPGVVYARRAAAADKRASGGKN